MHRFSCVVLVDERGWLLLQERDEFPVHDPDKWGFVGGHVEPGEEFEPAAYRELEEETGVRLAPGTLRLWGEFRPWRESRDESPMQVWVAAVGLTDADIDCREGRRIVFVDPTEVPGLDLGGPPAALLPGFLTSSDYQELCP